MLLDFLKEPAALLQREVIGKKGTGFGLNQLYYCLRPGDFLGLQLQSHRLRVGADGRIFHVLLLGHRAADFRNLLLPVFHAVFITDACRRVNRPAHGECLVGGKTGKEAKKVEKSSGRLESHAKAGAVSPMRREACGRKDAFM